MHSCICISISSEWMLRGPAGIAAVLLNNHHDSSSLPVEINKDNRLQKDRVKERFRRWNGGAWLKANESGGKEKRQMKRQLGRAEWESLIGFQRACADSDVLKGYSIWFVIFHGAPFLSSEERRGYRCPQSLIDGRIMPSDCESRPPPPPPNDKQQTHLATNNNERCAGSTANQKMDLTASP